MSKDEILKNGIEDLKRFALQAVADGYDDDHDRGWFNACCVLLDKINYTEEQYEKALST